MARAVRPGRERNPQFILMTGVLIVLRNAFADLRGRHPHDRFDGRIVVGILAEDLNAQRALFQQIRLTIDRCIHNVAEERRKPATIAKVRVGEQPLKLRFDGVLILLTEGFVRRRSFKRACHRPRCGDYTPNPR